MTNPSRAFDAALPLILRLEGGFANDPDDPGGRTMRGVTQRTYDSWRRARRLGPADVREITDEELRSIYLRNYWQEARCDLVAESHPKVALCLFDAAVNAGVRVAGRHLQEAIGAAPVDGWIGPITIAKLRRTPEAEALARMLDRRARFYKSLAAQRPPLRKFLDGWLARLRHIARKTGAPITPAFARAAQPTPPL